MFKGFLLGFLVATVAFYFTCQYLIDQAVENGQAQIFAQCSKTGVYDLRGVKMSCTVGIKEIRWD